MRIFALLIAGLSIAAWQVQKKSSQPEAVSCATTSDQASNLLFQSVDGGKTWLDISKGLPAKMEISVVFTQKNDVYLAAGSRLFHSNNPETGTWEEEHPDPVFPITEHITGVFAGQSGAYVSVFQGGFFRKIAGTKLWQRMDGGLDEKTIHVVLEASDRTLFAGAPSGLYKSTDEGKSWKKVHESWITNLTETNGALVLATTAGLFRSGDKGEHWECVLSDEGSNYSISVIESPVPVKDHALAALRVGGTWKSSVDAIPLRISSDNGKTWEPAQENLAPGEIVYSLQQADGYLFCSHKSGISRSKDGGKTWEFMRPAPDAPKPMFYQMAVSGTSVFAAPRRSGC